MKNRSLFGRAIDYLRGIREVEKTTDVERISFIQAETELSKPVHINSPSASSYGRQKDKTRRHFAQRKRRKAGKQ